MFLFFGALLGFVSVAFGAFAAHGLNDVASDASLNSLAVAVNYNQINAVVISAIGLAQIANPKIMNMSLLNWSASLFIIGTGLFSFSVYLSVVFESPGLTSLMPFGGMMIIAAWLLTAYVGFANVKDRNE